MPIQRSEYAYLTYWLSSCSHRFWEMCRSHIENRGRPCGNPLLDSGTPRHSPESYGEAPAAFSGGLSLAVCRSTGASPYEFSSPSHRPGPTCIPGDAQHLVLPLKSSPRQQRGPGRLRALSPASNVFLKPALAPESGGFLSLPGSFLFQESMQ